MDVSPTNFVQMMIYVDLDLLYHKVKFDSNVFKENLKNLIFPKPLRYPGSGVVLDCIVP